MFIKKGFAEKIDQDTNQKYWDNFNPDLKIHF